MPHDLQQPDDARLSVADVGQIDAVPAILDVICRTTGLRFAAVARVTGERWIACAVRDEIAFGLGPGGELPVETTLCDTVRQSREPVVIDHVAQDEVYCGHATPARYGFQSYISVPITLRDGSFFGTLCAIDPRPANLRTSHIPEMFRLFAELIGTHLTTMKRLGTLQATLIEEREIAALREEFVAVLGHDLRNPLAAITSGLALLHRTPLDARAAKIAAMMQASALRMGGLIDNVLDFARGRLGGGLSLERDAADDLAGMLRHIVAELRVGMGGRVLEADFRVDRPVCCDRRRIGQLFSNLLSNALTHGAAGTPVRAVAGTAGGMFELSVANRGEAIPASTRARLFQPFARGADRRGQGLGLGLYICAEIARAHGGTLDVASTDVETRFTFKMPLG